MYGAIAGVATSVIGSALASKQAAEEKRKRDEMVAQKEARINNELNYANRDRSQDATNQNLLNQGRAISQELVTRAQGANAVAGGTEAAVATAKQQAAKTNADATAAAVVNSEQARQSEVGSLRGALGDAENMKISNKNADVQSAIQKGNNFVQAGSGLITADSQAYLTTGRGVFDNMFGKKKNGQ